MKVRVACYEGYKAECKVRNYSGTLRAHENESE